MAAQPFTVCSKTFTSFRNIATCTPSQNLFDDLIGPKNYDDLQRHENASSQIEHHQPKKNRPFQYGDTGLSLYIFDELDWTYGRFGDGQAYGVWYGALEELTSIHEVAHHRKKESQEVFQNPKITDQHIVYQRQMLRAYCHTDRMVDFMPRQELYKKLTAEDYRYCQQLGRQAKKEKVGAFWTPSARLPQGICTPIFEPSAILRDEFVCYFDLLVDRDLRVKLRRYDRDQELVGI